VASNLVTFHRSLLAVKANLTLQVYSGLFWGLSERGLYSSEQVYLSPRLQEEERTLQYLRTSLCAGLYPWRLHGTKRLHLSRGSVNHYFNLTVP
jgi:hypothetical protein